jgi:post-segregation antitoxin (ccd killing protein)
MSITTATPSEQSRYRGNRRPANIILNGDLVDLARKFFPGTKYGSLSGFVETALKREFAKSAKKIRGAGHKMPEAVFAK